MLALRVGLFRGVGRRWLATGVPEPPLARRAQLFSESGAASLWQRLNQLAARPGMINMSQGFPDFEGSAVARRAAARALDDGPVNQYSPQPGYESLRHEVAAFYGRRYGAVIDPASEVLVCASGQEALAGVCVCVRRVCMRTDAYMNASAPGKSELHFTFSFLSISHSLSASVSLSLSRARALSLSLSLFHSLSLSHTHTHTLSLSLTHTHTHTGNEEENE